MNYDISHKLGSLESDKPIKMYSYERPAYTLWNSIYAALRERGWTDKQAVDWLQSKEARWALDGELGEAIIALGEGYAKKAIKV